MEYKLKELLQEKGYIRGPFGSSLKRKELKTSGIPVYEQQHAIYGTRDFRYYIDNQKYQEMKRFAIQPKDLIISCSGTIGKVGIISQEDKKGIISQALLILRVNDKIVLPEYLYYFFKSKDGYNSIISRSMGSVQVNIAKREVIENIKINIPTLEQQRKVITFLSNIDRKIELNKQMNDNLLKIINCLYKDTFKTIEEFEKAEDIANITIGKTPLRSEKECFTINKNDMKWSSISDLGKCGTYIFNTAERLTLNSICKYKVKVIPRDTIILSFKLTIGRVAITTEEMTTNEAIAHFNLKNEDMKYYLYTYLKNFDYTKLGSTSSIATAVNSKIIKTMPIGVPSNEILKEYNAKVHCIFKKILQNEKENQILGQLRDTLLPKLMKGAINLDKIEI